MVNETLKLVQKYLEDPTIKADPQLEHLISLLANDHVQLNKINRGINTEESFPDIDSIRYKAAQMNESVAINNSLESVRNQLQEYLSNAHHENFAQITSDRNARTVIEKAIRDYCIEKAVSIEGKSKDETIELLIKSILDYDVLTDLIFDYDRPDDQKIQEIRVDDYNDIKIVIKGQTHQTNISFDTPEKALAIAEKLCRNAKGGHVKVDNPFVRLRMGNNIRVSIMISPVARRPDDNVRPVVQMVIRKQANKPFDSSFLTNVGTIDGYGDKLIETLIRNKISMAFYGGTNSGKTGTMNSYAHRLKKKNRTITIAEIDEMNLRLVDPVSGKAINAALMWEIQPKHGVNFQKLINYALTMTPETLILQEIKGAETVDVIDAAITGHQVITTLHADNVAVFGKRCLGMYKQSGSDLTDDLILEYVAEAFDILVKMKIYDDGKRRIEEISELESYDRNSGKFKTKTLVEFKVTDTDTKIVINEQGLEEEVSVVKGYHRAVEFLSDSLLKKLLGNGTPRKTIDELKQTFNMARRD